MTGSISVSDIVSFVSHFGIGGLFVATFVVILITGYRQMWYFGYVRAEDLKTIETQRETISGLREDRNTWRLLAMSGASAAERTAVLAQAIGGKERDGL
jgi:hypothetical protein